MHPDKKLMLTALILLVTLFSFQGKIFEEIKYFKEVEGCQMEAFKISERLQDSYYFPLTQQDRMHYIQSCADGLTTIQNKFSKSLFLKRAVNFQNLIAQCQDELIERQHLVDEGESEEMVSFYTPQKHEIVADSTFERKNLLHLARIIDYTFPEETHAIFTLERASNLIILNIFLGPNEFGFKNLNLKKLSTRISNEVFGGESVFVQMD